MARVTVTTDDGIVVEVFRENRHTTDDLDNAIPASTSGPGWHFFTQDLAAAVDRARAQEATDAL